MSEELRERIARALRDHNENEPQEWRRASKLAQADAVIAALGLVEETRTLDKLPGRTWRRYVTPWERIEEDG